MYNITHYALFFVLLLAIELLYFKLAKKYNIIDKPNLRSSHSYITLRGGGIIFPLAILVLFLLGEVSLPFFLASTIVAVVSFIDDINPLKPLPRFISHLVAMTLILYNLHIFTTIDFYFIPFIYILMIGWVNAFNFMDGINGITVIYALVSIITFTFLPINDNDLTLLIAIGTSCIVFAIFNFRKKAKAFSGDVGSISMAIILSYFMIKTILLTEKIGFILFFSVYAIDAVFTILFRLKRKENIFESHRSHLYQYLANELKYSHLIVASIYGVLQVLINIFVIKLYDSGKLSNLNSFFILTVLSIIYLIIRGIITRNKVFNTSNSL